jgi:flagellar export protein FliJ
VTFRFRLQRVLDLRRDAEQECARVLTSASARVAECEARCAELASTRAAAAAGQRDAARDGTTAGALQHTAWMLAQLDQQLDAAHSALETARADEERARTLLAQASQERRVLDRLEDRHRDAWRADTAARDRVAMDEIALGRHARRADTPSHGAPRSA